MLAPFPIHSSDVTRMQQLNINIMQYAVFVYFAMFDVVWFFLPVQLHAWLKPNRPVAGEIYRNAVKSHEMQYNIFSFVDIALS
jgi:hypothetical protein